MDVRYEKGAAATLLRDVGRVERGETASVPDEQGEQLIAQGWEKVKASRPTKTTAADAGNEKE